MKLGLHLPINSVSFGQTSTVLLRTIFERQKAGDDTIDWYIFPIGQVDLSAQNVDQEFQLWLQNHIIKAYEKFTRDIPTFKLWHLNGSFEAVSNHPTLFSFYELDKPTRIELNIAKNNNIVFSSKYTCDVFNIFGVNAKYLPLPFDSFNFKTLNKPFINDGRIVFNFCGKFERRKHTDKVIKTWIKKYGGNRKYVLQCAVNNPFFTEQQNAQLINNAVNGSKPFNVVFYPNMKENSIYNEFLNSGDIILGMSGGEGWGLPEFQSVALGKHSVILNAHSYKSWADSKNSVLVEPSKQVEAFDGVFFKKGDAFNQGNIFDWDENDFIEACEKAIAKVNTNKVNSTGLELQETYSKEKFADGVINLLKT